MSTLKIVLSVTSSGIIYLLGGFDIALYSLLIFIVIDYITGIMKAYKNKTLNSNKGFEGILKKIGILILVVVSNLIDLNMGDSGLIRTIIIYYLAANEGLSIIENLGEMGILIPKLLIEKLEQLKSNNE